MLKLSILCIVIFAACTGQAISAERGAADWLASDDEPINYRGDFTGVFPGANPPVSWDESKNEGIAWRTTMPGYTCSSPIAVAAKDGSIKVFTLAGPDQLVCCDGKTGEILWTAGCLDVMLPKIPKDQHQAWRDDYLKEYRWGALSKDRHVNMMKRAAEAMPGNDGVAGFINDERVEDTSTVTPMDVVNDRGGRVYEHFWTADTFVPPVSDGSHVYVRFNYGGVVACFDMQGKRVWAKAMSPAKGGGISPKDGSTNDLILYQNLLYIPSTRSGAMAVVDKKTGKMIKQHKGNKGPISLDRGQTAVLVTMDGEDYFITGFTGWDGGPAVIRAKDGEFVGTLKLQVSGKARKRVVGPNNTNFMMHDGKLYCSLGSYYYKKGNGAIALELSRNGDQFIAKELWYATSASVGKLPHKFKWNMTWRGSICHDGKMLIHASNKGALINLSDGKLASAGEFFSFGDFLPKGAPKGEEGTSVGNPVAAQGRIYIPTWGGFTAVVEAKSGKTLSVNRNEPMWSSGFFPHGDHIYIRGKTSLYCIGPVMK